jgi:hypothetical protein
MDFFFNINSFSFLNCSLDNLLVFLLVISPLLLILILLFIPNYKFLELKVIGLVGSFLIFFISVL